MWHLRNLEVYQEVVSLDFVSGDVLALFGHQTTSTAADGGSRGIGVLRLQSLQGGKVLGNWRFPSEYPSIAAGCTSGVDSMLVVTNDRPPRLLSGKVPKV